MQLGSLENVQIIIPMAGKSQRFFDAGYKKPKSLIEFSGRPMIGHILKVFEKFTDVLLIVNEEDFSSHEITRLISSFHKNAKVVKIKQHSRGPSYSVLEASEYIDQSKKIIVHYCDVSGKWDPLTTVKLLESYDGVFVTFKGFHPSRIYGTKFAYGKVSDDNLVTEIREKSSFTEFPEAENASSGIYGFSSGAQMLESITYQINKNLHVNGEFYTSLTLGAMLENEKKIINQNMDLYYSWGTPEDLETFNYYLDICRNINFSDEASSNIIGHNGVVLAAGKSSRLRTLNKKPKQSKILLDRKQLLDFSFNLIENKEKTFLVATAEIYSQNIYDLPQKNLRILTHASESQIATVEISLELIEKKDIPVTFLASDNIMFFDKEKKLEFNQSSADLLVWTSANFPVSKVNSEQYSWVKVNDDNTVENVIYKNSPKELRSWKLVTGNFTFRNSLIVRELIEGLSLKLQALNREPILDDLVGVALSLGYNVRAFDVTEYVTLGTELEERVFDYHSEIFKYEYSL